jgi:hypothetical protein
VILCSLQSPGNEAANIVDLAKARLEIFEQLFKLNQERA